MDKLYCGGSSECWVYTAHDLLIFVTIDLSELGVQRGMQGLNTNNLAYKLRLGEEAIGLNRHQQAFVCGIVLEGGTDIVSPRAIYIVLCSSSNPFRSPQLS